MEAVIENGRLIAEPNQTLRRRKFGRVMGEKIELHPVEAAYLLMKGLLRIKKGEDYLEMEHYLKEASESEDFPHLFFVYSDLRDRGKRVMPDDEFLFGDRIYFPVSERRTVTIPELYDIYSKKGEYVLAVVDEEGEITYYSVYEPELLGKGEEVDFTVHSTIAGDRVITKNVEIFEKFFYGSEKSGFVTLSIIEALYLYEKGILKINEKPDRLRKIAEKIERNFEERYGVYRDLKEKGLVVKTGFKFGSDFRVYTEITDVSQLPHSKFLVYVVGNRKLSLQEISRAVRLANNVRKKMVFTFSRNGERKYLVLDRIKV